MREFKKLFILIMSIGIIFTITNLVYAADDDPFLELNVTNSTNTEISNTDANNSNNTNTNTDSGNSLLTTNTENSSNDGFNSLTTNNIIANNSVNNVNNINRSVSNTEQLAKTGLSDSKGMIALIVLLCGISAIYSYKKINDYKRL